MSVLPPTTQLSNQTISLFIFPHKGIFKYSKHNNSIAVICLHRTQNNNMHHIFILCWFSKTSHTERLEHIWLYCVRELLLPNFKFHFGLFLFYLDFFFKSNWTVKLKNTFKASSHRCSVQVWPTNGLDQGHEPRLYQLVKFINLSLKMYGNYKYPKLWVLMTVIKNNWCCLANNFESANYIQWMDFKTDLRCLL